SAIPNASGVLVDAGGTVGGTAAGAGNVISGNDGDGLRVAGTVATLVVGNFIGTNALGNAALGNVAFGLVLDNSPGNTVGGTTASAANVISGNFGGGIHVFGPGSTGNLIEGNFIGTDVTGGVALGNLGDGILIQDAPNNVVGGVLSLGANVIAANSTSGVR